MRSLVKKYLVDGDATTAWLIMKAPFLVAVIYLVPFLRGDRQALLITLFFFPYVFLLFKNLWLEILHDELLKKLKTESGLEIELTQKLFRITRFTIAGLSVAELYLVPKLLESPARPTFSDIPIIFLATVTLILTLAVFFMQVRFAFHTGKLLRVIETKRKYDPQKETNSVHKLRTLNPVAFRKTHERIKILLKKV